ncbi:hypothetical protein NQZ68_039144 [Dissostichus eleginoides]|nr:hypothetical protein NQZ68_039144 [Dissostichus eleginoides]
MDSDDNNHRCDSPETQLAAAQPLNHLSWVQLGAVQRSGGWIKTPTLSRKRETLSPG